MKVKDFFKNVEITGYGYNDNEKEKLKNELMEIHNRNFMFSSIKGYVVKINLEYKTSKGNKVIRDKYVIMNLDENLDIDLEYQAEIMCESSISFYNVNHWDNELREWKVRGVEVICGWVVKVGE